MHLWRKLREPVFIVTVGALVAILCVVIGQPFKDIVSARSDVLIAAAHRQTFDKEGGGGGSTQVFRRGKTLYFRGPITASDLVKVRQAVAGADTLIITSPGGEEQASIEFGELVFKNGLSVEIVDLCGSGCAQYVFPAGKTKIIHHRAVLACHWNVFGRSWIWSFRESPHWNGNRALLDRAAALYKAIGVSQDYGLVCMARLRPACWGLSQRGAGAPEDSFIRAEHESFIPLADQLEAFGITRVRGAPISDRDVAMRMARWLRKSGGLSERGNALPFTTASSPINAEIDQRRLERLVQCP